MLIMETGVPLYRPVMVRKPRSDSRVKGFGTSSRKVAIRFARDGLPTVTFDQQSLQFETSDIVKNRSRSYNSIGYLSGTQAKMIYTQISRPRKV
jgi:hypothetical protein